ncbi:5737_t:CDS:2 [Gigaspora rosea]|nr:5737_t:CDS:2 [Gigaspora rosea]
MSAENAQSVEKIASEVQQEVQQEDGLEFAHQPFINYEERIRSLESSIQTSNNQINCLETSVQTSNNENKNLKEIVELVQKQFLEFIESVKYKN